MICIDSTAVHFAWGSSDSPSAGRHQLAIVGRSPLFSGISRTIVVPIASLYLIEKSFLPFGGTFLAFSIIIPAGRECSHLLQRLFLD